MKTIGLIGGMSWESTVPYYQIINRAVAAGCGGLHSARCILYSVDFAEIERCQANGEWERSGDILTKAAQALERAGADFLVICTNTMHKVAPQIAAGIGIPILHIATATAAALQRDGVRRVGLLGTKYTMTQAFYKDKLTEAGMDVLVPSAEEIETVNTVIYDELCRGIRTESSRAAFRKIMEGLAAAGAEGIILGCTEIGLLVGPEDTTVKLYDTTAIHAAEAARLAMEG